MTTDDEYSDALRAALDAVGNRHRPSWRYLSTVFTRSLTPAPAKPKPEPVNADISLGRVRFGDPVARHRLGRIKWVH